MDLERQLLASICGNCEFTVDDAVPDACFQCHAIFAPVGPTPVLLVHLEAGMQDLTFIVRMAPEWRGTPPPGSQIPARMKRLLRLVEK